MLPQLPPLVAAAPPPPVTMTMAYFTGSSDGGGDAAWSTGNPNWSGCGCGDPNSSCSQHKNQIVVAGNKMWQIRHLRDVELQRILININGSHMDGGSKREIGEYKNCWSKMRRSLKLIPELNDILIKIFNSILAQFRASSKKQVLHSPVKSKTLTFHRNTNMGNSISSRRRKELTKALVELKVNLFRQLSTCHRLRLLLPSCGLSTVTEP